MVVIFGWNDRHKPRRDGQDRPGLRAVRDGNFKAAQACDGDVEYPCYLKSGAKSNISPSGGGFGYDIVAAPLYERPDIIATRITWHEPIEGSARELLGEAEGEEPSGALSKQDQAKRFLKAALSNGERPQKEIEAEAKQEGIAEHTLRRAAKDIATSRKDGFRGGWYWRLA
jgi:putative DNA primase/helicase